MLNNTKTRHGTLKSVFYSRAQSTFAYINELVVTDSYLGGSIDWIINQSMWPRFPPHRAVWESQPCPAAKEARCGAARAGARQVVGAVR